MYDTNYYTTLECLCNMMRVPVFSVLFLSQVGCKSESMPTPLHPCQPSPFCPFYFPFILSSHFPSCSSFSHSGHFFPSSLTFSAHFSALVSSLSIIIYLHSVHFLPSLIGLRWGVFLVRNCNEDWNTISWMATVSFLHHLELMQSDRCCCCCCFGFPVCSYWCVSSSVSRYC